MTARHCLDEPNLEVFYAPDYELQAASQKGSERLRHLEDLIKDSKVIKADRFHIPKARDDIFQDVGFIVFPQNRLQARLLPVSAPRDSDSRITIFGSGVTDCIKDGVIDAAGGSVNDISKGTYDRVPHALLDYFISDAYEAAFFKAYPRKDLERSYIAVINQDNITCPGDSGAGYLARREGGLTLVAVHHGVLADDLRVYDIPSAVPVFGTMVGTSGFCEVAIAAGLPMQGDVCGSNSASP